MKRIFKFFGRKKSSHDCRDIVSKLQELIDGEIDEQTEQSLIKEIQRCPACLEHYDLDKAFKDFLQKKIDRKCCTEKAKQNILEKIKNIEA